MSEIRVAAVVGSLRDGSHTRTACRETLASAEVFGSGRVETDCIDLREFELPVFDADQDDAGDAEALRERMQAADSVALGSPVYHGSVSSPLKNALDYCGFEEFEDTTVGLLCVAGGAFPTTTLDHLRSIGRSLNAWVVPHQVAIPRASNCFEDGQLVDDGVGDRIDTLGQRLVEYANIEPDPPTLESTSNPGAGD